MSSAPPPPPPASDPNEPREPAAEAGREVPRQTPHDGPSPAGAPQQPEPPYADQQQYGNQPQYSNQPQYAEPGQPQHGAPAGTATPLGDSEEKTWAILAHLSAPVAALISAGLLNFVGPLVIWAIFKDRSPKVRHASAGAFNFNLTLWIAYAALIVLSVVSLGLLLIVTIPIGLVIWVVSMVLHVLAAIKASNGEVYTYPAQIPVLK